MGMWRLIGRLFFLLLVVSLLIVLLPDAALSQPESIELEATYARIESTTPRDGFQFAINLKYRGYQARTFDLRTSGPEGWTTYVTPGYGSTQISAIELEPDAEGSRRVKVIAFPSADKVPPPGEYRITLLCSSGTIGSSIELTAVIMPAYSAALTLFPSQYYNEVKAGRDNVLSMSVRNTGSGAITNIRLSSIEPLGWFISFEPDEIDYLSPGSSQSFDLTIRPDADTASGNYQITVIAEADQTGVSQEIRVEVDIIPTVWIWVGVAVICLVVAGFVIVYMRFGRR